MASAVMNQFGWRLRSLLED